MVSKFDLGKEIDRMINNKIYFLYNQLEEKDKQINFLQELIKNIWNQKNKNSN